MPNNYNNIDKPKKPVVQAASQETKVVQEEVTPLELSTPVAIKKPGLFKRITHNFMGDKSFKDITGQVAGEIVLPAIKSIVADSLGTAIQLLIYGESAPVRNRRDYSTRQTGSRAPQRVQYDRQSQVRYTQNRRAATRGPVESFRSVDTFVYGSRQDAETVLRKLCDRIDVYGFVTTSDYYKMTGVDPAYTDLSFGWTDLSAARIDLVRDGFVIVLPDSEYIEA